MMTDTCINYQVFMPPVFGEHVAFGDTGSSIYTDSVLGARTNFEEDITAAIKTGERVHVHPGSGMVTIFPTNNPI